MREFASRAIRIFIILYVVILGLQFVLDHFLSKENSCNNNTWHKIFEGELDTDIAILGTSRAEVHYDTEVIERITGLKTYNLGLSGSPYSILKIRWRSYINRNKKPKILILDLDASNLQDSKELFEKFQYLPYFNSDEYQSFAKENDDDFYFEKLIPMYKYRGYEMKIFKQLKTIKNTELCSRSVNGYIGKDLNWSQKEYDNFKRILNDDRDDAGEFELDVFDEGLSVLKEIIADCKKNNIKLFFIWSPSFHESHTYQAEYKRHADSLLSNIALKETIPYLNFSKDSLCLNKNYFYNSMHLNKKGATIFSEKIGDLIKE